MSGGYGGRGPVGSGGRRLHEGSGGGGVEVPLQGGADEGVERDGVVGIVV